MAADVAQVRAWLVRYRSQSGAIAVALVAVIGFVAFGVRARRAAQPLRLESASLSMAADEISRFHAAFSAGLPEQELRVTQLADSLGVAVSRDNRVALAQQVAARAESLGLAGVRVKFVPVDSGVPPQRPELLSNSVNVADYALVLDCDGGMAAVLSLLDQLPPSIALERLTGAKSRAGSQFRLTFAVFESAGRTAEQRPSPQLAPLMAFAHPVSDSLRAPDQSFAPVTLSRDPFGAVPVAPVSVRLAAEEPRTKGQKTEAPEWDVTATLIAGARRAALINGVLVSVGDAVPGGATLTAVERDRVVLIDQKGSAHTIAVKEGER